jgi:hypothetical protein
MIRGIGPAYAKKLLRAFGEKVFDIMDECVRLLALGADLLKAWQAPTTSLRDKKELLRTLLEERHQTGRPTLRHRLPDSLHLAGAFPVPWDSTRVQPFFFVLLHLTWQRPRPHSRVHARPCSRQPASRVTKVCIENPGDRLVSCPEPFSRSTSSPSPVRLPAYRPHTLSVIKVFETASSAN